MSYYNSIRADQPTRPFSVTPGSGQAQASDIAFQAQAAQANGGRKPSLLRRLFFARPQSNNAVTSPSPPPELAGLEFLPLGHDAVWTRSTERMPSSNFDGMQLSALNSWAAWADTGENRAEAVTRISHWVNNHNWDEPLDLSGLNLTSLPATLPGEIRILDVSANPLAAQVLSNLAATVNAPGYRGPKIHYTMPDDDQTAAPPAAPARSRCLIS